jgi:hypothetical protein
MARSPFVSLGIAAALVGFGAARAAEIPPSAVADGPEGPGIERATTAPVKSRPVSPEKAAQLAAVVPKFEPVPQPPAEPPPDLRETDKPRNTIIRLPDFVVQQRKAPVLKERDVLTAEAKLELALRKNPGLRFGSFWIFRNDGIALLMAAEEERLEKKREMGELIRLMPASQQKQVKPLVEQAFMREPASFR